MSMSSLGCVGTIILPYSSLYIPFILTCLSFDFPMPFTFTTGRGYSVETWNPRINWKSHSLSFPASSPTDYDKHILPQRYLLHWLGLDVDQELLSLYNQQYSSKVDASPREYLPQEEPLDESIQKITLSTQLAQDAKNSPYCPNGAKISQTCSQRKHTTSSPLIAPTTTPLILNHLSYRRLPRSTL